MKEKLAADLKKAAGLAFGRVTGREPLIRKFHALKTKVGKHPDHRLLEKIYEWLFVPLSLWPIDMRGMALHALGCVADGKELDPEARLLCAKLPEAPAEETRKRVDEYEQAVKEGSYESLIEAQHKFDLIEQELRKNQELRADWSEIKERFKVNKYRNAIGVIRRRPVQERNFHSTDWKFSWETDKQRFQNVFDAFCHKWNLYGMQGDEPLLLKLTVSVTPYGTMLMIPKYWSIDPKRDMKWKRIGKLHRAREVRKQGLKLASNKLQRKEESKRAKALWQESRDAGLKGDERVQWVMAQLGWVPNTAPSRLWALLREKG